MRKVLTLVFVAIMCLGLASTTWAQAWPTDPGTSGVQVVNMTTDSGTVAALYIAEDGTQYALPDQTVAGGASYTWYAEPSTETTFRGAVQLSSDVQVAAIAKTEWGSGAVSGAAAYSGQSAGASTVVLPLLVIEHYGTTSAFSVQNTDTSGAIIVDLEFTPQGGTAFTKTMSIAAGASTTWDMAFDTDFVDPSAGNAGWLGSVTITSATPVVAAAHTTDAVNGFVYAYDGFSALDQTTAYAPLVRHNFVHLTTGIQVVDASGAGGTVQVKYNGFADANGNYVMDSGEEYVYTDTTTLAAGSSATFYQGSPYFNAPAVMMPEHFLGSAEVTVSGAGAAIAVVVNDQSHPGYAGKQTSSAYSGFFANQSTDTLVSPLARSAFASFTTGIQVMNIGGDSVDVNIAYTTSPLSTNTGTPSAITARTLAPGASTTYYLPSDWAGETGWLGSAEVTATGTGDLLIVAITNDQDTVALSGDTAIFNNFNK